MQCVSCKGNVNTERVAAEEKTRRVVEPKPKKEGDDDIPGFLVCGDLGDSSEEWILKVFACTQCNRAHKGDGLGLDCFSKIGYVNKEGIVEYRQN